MNPLIDKEIAVLNLIPFVATPEKGGLVQEPVILKSLSKAFPTTKEEVHQIINSLWERQLIGRWKVKNWYRLVNEGTKAELPQVTRAPREPRVKQTRSKEYIPQNGYSGFGVEEIIRALSSPDAQSGLSLNEVIHACPTGMTVSRITVLNRLRLLIANGRVNMKKVTRIDKGHRNVSMRGKEFIQSRRITVNGYFLVRP